MKRLNFLLVVYLLIISYSASGRRIQGSFYPSIIQKITPSEWVKKLELIRITFFSEKELFQTISQILSLDKTILAKITSIDSVLEAIQKLSEAISEGKTPQAEEIKALSQELKKAYNYFTFIPRLRNGQIPINKEFEVLVHSYGISFYNHPVYYEFENGLFDNYQDFLIRLEAQGILTLIGITPEGEKEVLARTPVSEILSPSENDPFQVISTSPKGVKLKTGLLWNDILIVAKAGAKEQYEIFYKEFNTSFEEELQKALSWIERFYRSDLEQKFKYTTAIEIYPTPASLWGFITGGTIGENGVVRVETSGNAYNLAFRIVHENVHTWFRSFELTYPLLKDRELEIRNKKFFNEEWDKYRSVWLILTEISAYLEHSLFTSWILSHPEIQKEAPPVQWKYVEGSLSRLLMDLDEQINLIDREVYHKNLFTPAGRRFFERVKYLYKRLNYLQN